MAPEHRDSDRTILVLIACDPRVDHRAAEALRIGVGLAAAGGEVVLVLVGEAIHLLDTDPEDLVGGDDVAGLRQSLRRLDLPVHVVGTVVPAIADRDDRRHPLVPLTRGEIVDHVTRARRTLVFP